MKKISLLLFLATALLGLPSCLDGGENSATYTLVGVVDFSAKSMNIVMKSNLGDVYAPQLTSLKIGGCYSFTCAINYDDEANSTAAVERNGYYTGAFSNVSEVDFTGSIQSYLSDTTEVMEREVAISDGLYGTNLFGYAGGHLFFYHELAELSDNVIEWNLSYDPSGMAVVGNGDSRFYDIYLRAVKTTTTEKRSGKLYLNAYGMEHYLKSAAQNERSLLGGNYTNASVFTLRVNYPTAVSEDGLIWGSRTVAVPISSFIEAE